MPPDCTIDYYALNSDPQSLADAESQLREHTRALNKALNNLLKTAGIPSR